MLKSAGLNEESTEEVKGALKAWKEEVEESALDLQQEAIQEQIDQGIETGLKEKGSVLFDKINEKMQEESKACRQELSSKVSLYLESKKASLEEEARLKVIEEQKADEGNAEEVLKQVASLVGFFHEESQEEDTDKVAQLEEEVESLKKSNSELKLENVEVSKKAKLLEENLKSSDSDDGDDEIGKDDLLEENQDAQDDFEEDNKNKTSIASLVAKTLKK
jgi:hypothetical protein